MSELIEQNAIIEIAGMRCDGCAQKVEKGLMGVAGVRQVKVDLAGKRAEVRFDPASVTIGKMMAAVTGAGFSATGFTRIP